jgi:hypothetical protein
MITPLSCLALSGQHSSDPAVVFLKDDPDHSLFTRIATATIEGNQVDLENRVVFSGPGDRNLEGVVRRPNAACSSRSVKRKSRERDGNRSELRLGFGSANKR